MAIQRIGSGRNFKQDGRLALANFSPNYKYFDQLLQTVKNKTTVLNLVFKEFLQTSISPMISVLYAKGYHDFPSKLFFLTLPNHFVEDPFCVSEHFGYRKILCLRGGHHDFLSKICCLTVPKNFVGKPFGVSQNFWYGKILWISRGRGGREYHDFPLKIFGLTVPKIFVGEPFSVSLIPGIEKC